MKGPIFRRWPIFALLVVVAAVIVSTGLLAQVIPPTIKGQEVAIKGEVIDLYCYMHRELKGVGHKTCSTKCASQGNPIGLIDAATNDVYVLIGIPDYQASHEIRDSLIKQMNYAITVTGTVVKKGNSQILYVKSFEGQPL